MKTTNETTNKGGHQNNYPYMTKAQIKARILTDETFALECMAVMHDRQTAYEQERNTTVTRNARGWMSSHAVTMGHLRAKILNCEELTAEEIGKIQGTVARYGKQLAEHFRSVANEENPALATAAAAFFAN